MWVTNAGSNSVTKVSPTGAMKTYPGIGANALGIASDGTNMWVTDTNNNGVTEISPVGAMTEYPGTGGYPSAIAFDGTNMWSANFASSSVTRIRVGSPKQIPPYLYLTP